MESATLELTENGIATKNAKKIKNVVISVFYKDKLDLIVKELDKLGVTIYSTGGTHTFIENLGVKAIKIEDLTEFPEMLGGRVKTLHPKVFAGILARTANEEDIATLEKYRMPAFDVIINNLYPFKETLKKTSDEKEIVEKIDIGGISLIRAAAKNFEDVFTVSSPEQYDSFLRLLREKEGTTELADRKSSALDGFMVTSDYETAIANWFNRGGERNALRISMNNGKILRYGENPHQRGIFYGNLDEIFEILNGKELSFNNLGDVESAVYLLDEFTDPTAVIIKHTNSCGLASRKNICEAYKAAFACDTTSAFGGVVAVNKRVDVATAKEMHSLFFEILIASDYEPEALAILKQKKNRIILKQVSFPREWRSSRMLVSCLNGYREQDIDTATENRTVFKTVTDKHPTSYEIADMEFALIAAKHLKSNCVALVKNRQLIGMGSGQTSRVDALNDAIRKAREFGFKTAGAVMASEAYFPFPDCVNIAHQAGITAIVQPGGSLKDADSIEAANHHGIAMGFSGKRHFRHM